MSTSPAAARVIALLEHSAGAVAPPDVSELDRADVRHDVEDQLATVGRRLVEHRHDDRLVAIASGYDDRVADRLAAEGLGVLDPIDRAVVALVLLHTVGRSTAAGHPPVPWSSADGVRYERLHDNRSLGKQAVTDAVSRLDRLGVLHNARAHGIRPGPVLDRLTDRQRRTIEVRLLGVATPHDPVVASLMADFAVTRADPEHPDSVHPDSVHPDQDDPGAGYGGLRAATTRGTSRKDTTHG